MAATLYVRLAATVARLMLGVSLPGEVQRPNLERALRCFAEDARAVPVFDDVVERLRLAAVDGERGLLSGRRCRRRRWRVGELVADRLRGGVGQAHVADEARADAVRVRDRRDEQRVECRSSDPSAPA